MYPVIKGRGAAFLLLSPRFAVLPSGPLTFVGCNERSSSGRQQEIRRRERIDYSSPEHAGEPHRGTVSETEAEYVRNNLPEVNERLERAGFRTIDINDPEMATRYRLETSVGRDDAEAEGEVPQG